MTKLIKFVFVMLVCAIGLIGCNKVVEPLIPKEGTTLEEETTLEIDMTRIQEIRIGPPKGINKPETDLIATITNKNHFAILIDVLSHAKHDPEPMQDIRHDYELHFITQDGKTFEIDYWVKYNRFNEVVTAKNYVFDAQSADKMKKLFEDLGIK